MSISKGMLGRWKEGEKWGQGVGSFHSMPGTRGGDLQRHSTCHGAKALSVHPLPRLVHLGYGADKRVAVVGERRLSARLMRATRANSLEQRHPAKNGPWRFPRKMGMRRWSLGTAPSLNEYLSP